jgi:PAS domain S-box-containing protein
VTSWGGFVIEKPAEGARAMEGLDTLIQVIGSPAYFFDMDSHKLLSVNRPFAEMMEYEESELLGMTVADLRPAEEIPKLLKALKQSPPQGTVEWLYRTRTGSLLRVRLSYRNSLYIDKVNGRRHEIRLVVVSTWDKQPVRSSDELFG